MSAMSAMSAMSCEFNASVYVSEQMSRQLVNIAQDLAQRCVTECANHYGFDAEEAIRLLGLSMIRLERKVATKAKTSKAAKVATPKSAFPLPYNGEFNDACCYALRQNNGLYTQCTGVRKGEAQFCKSCATTLQKTGAEMPEYGTIQQRQAVGIFEYVDPKGRKPVAYTKIMKKHKINEEQVLAEAGKFNIIINPEHFVVAESESKRGRPKAIKEPKVKGVKGRPKKEKKVLLIADGDDEDLFDLLIKEANDETEETKKKTKSSMSDEERQAKEQAKLEEKAKEREAKRIAAENAKKEKEAKLAAEKAEKEALAKQKKEAERLAREAKKAEEEAAKEAKRLAAEKAKADKAAEKAAKEAKKTSKKEPEPEPEKEEEPEKVKKIEFEGKKYLKSMKSGIIYDYNEYVKNGEQVVVGKWNDAKNKIDFTENDEEEEEEEYDM